MSVPWDQPVGSIPDPIVDEEAGLHWHWYYDPNAGGMAVPFRKYRGTPIHALDMAYLLWCRRECTKAVSFAAAFDNYHAGLCEHVDSEIEYYYLDFLVPFGNVTERLGDCRDQPYFLFCRKKKKLTQKHPLFFHALQRLLDNPRKYEVWRDVGELLDVTKYADDLNLKIHRMQMSPPESIQTNPLSRTRTSLLAIQSKYLLTMQMTRTPAGNSNKREKDLKEEIKTVQGQGLTRKRSRNTVVDEDSEGIVHEDSDGAETYVGSGSSRTPPPVLTAAAFSLIYIFLTCIVW
ncbi:hypothetical protein B0H13DRAFT_2499301 [Mycena leptocephala]|nr:hypothetical protein B0H13DRAFT_2499301 [Mycena leptocephala]